MKKFLKYLAEIFDNITSIWIINPIPSEVPNFKGPCRPTWLNNNEIDIRLTGSTGFFRVVNKKFGIYWKIGKEFHGRIEIYKPSDICL